MINVLSHIFFFLLGVSVLCVVSVQNTFFALLFLILSFLLVSIILFFFECEFLALILVIIYVGAVAVLLLFVLMMLETKLKSLSTNIVQYFPFGIVINGFLFFELSSLIAKSFSNNLYSHSFSFNISLNWYEKLDCLIDLEVYGQILYTQFVLQVLIVGLILFLALVGVIFLTSKPIFQNVKSQTSFCQLSRSYFFTVSPIIDFYNLDTLSFSQVALIVEPIKIQELTFLSEYFLITALFCLTLFALSSLKFVSKNNSYFVKFQYENPFIFLLVLTLVFYLILLSQQFGMSSLSLTSFNETIFNDQLSVVSKWILGLAVVLYLLFVDTHLKNQKLNNFEYYLILLISVFGFFLLCCVNDFITTYLAIELQGLAFYVLASFKKSSNFSIESGVKYFVLGSFSTALFLLGITMVYGLSGSILLTDYKDFFIGVFLANSLFFSFDSFSQICELFQEKIVTSNDSGFNLLKIMSNKLSLAEESIGLPGSEVYSIKPMFGSFEFNGCAKIEEFSNLVKKFLEYYNESCANSILSFYDFLKQASINFLQVSLFISSINDFLFENSFQNSSINLLYVMQENQLDYQNFINFKMYLIESNYYEDIKFEELCGVSKESIGLVEHFSDKVALNNNLTSDSCLSHVYNLLDCYCFSDFLQNSGLNTFGTGKHFTYFLEEFVTIEPTNWSCFNFGFQGSSTLQFYIFSITRICNINSFFFKSFDINLKTLFPTFDLNFIVIGLLVILLALFFKLALAPFHLWSPDVYEGSPASSTFFFMVLSKFGIFVFLLRLCYFSFYSFIFFWQFYSLFVASVSIFVGAVAGLKQRKLKSLLTYSSINNMGFVLLAFSVGGFEGIQVKFYYLIVYMLASISFWSLILNMQLKKNNYLDKQNRDLGDLVLLQESNSIIAQGLGITLFSLAGLPPMVGFLAKMGVFAALSGISIYYFSVINILFSVIATFYYLRIVKIIFFENLLVGNLYVTMSLKTAILANFLIFLLIFLFFNPMFLYLWSYKIALLLNKSFF